MSKEEKKKYKKIICGGGRKEKLVFRMILYGKGLIDGLYGPPAGASPGGPAVSPHHPQPGQGLSSLRLTSSRGGYSILNWRPELPGACDVDKKRHYL